MKVNILGYNDQVIAILDDEHAASSYGIPVLLWRKPGGEFKAYGPLDVLDEGITAFKLVEGFVIHQAKNEEERGHGRLFMAQAYGQICNEGAKS